MKKHTDLRRLCEHRFDKPNFDVYRPPKKRKFENALFSPEWALT